MSNRESLWDREALILHQSAIPDEHLLARNHRIDATARPLIPLLGVASCVILMLSLPVGTWIRLVVWLSMGVIVYAAFAIFRPSRKAPPEPAR